jgi:hypothetical protein
MSQYKHVYNALDNAMKNLKQAQECCDDIMHIDKESCGSWKKQIKAVEKELGTCYKKVEGKHKKGPAAKKVKTASAIDDLLDSVFGEGEYAEEEEGKELYRTRFQKRAQQEDYLDAWDDEELDARDDEDFLDDEEYGNKNAKFQKRAQQEDETEVDGFDFDFDAEDIVEKVATTKRKTRMRKK